MPNRKVNAVTARGNNPVDAHVGGRVRLQRRILGFTQIELAQALGLTFQQVQKYERGLNRISASRLHDMAKILGVPVAFFFEEMPDELKSLGPQRPAEALQVATVAAEEDLTNSETLALVKAYYRIADPRLRRRVCDLARALGDTTLDQAECS